MKQRKDEGRRIHLLSDLRYAFGRLIKRLKPTAIRGSTIHPTSTINGGSQVVQSVFGRHSYCGYDCVFLNVEVGSFCSFSDNVIVGGSGHPMHFVSTSPAFLSDLSGTKTKLAHFEFTNLPRTKIGSDVWIGRGALIRSGVNIGHGAVVGMGSVVTRDVAPYMIVGGNPAQVIRPRFEENIAQRLLASEWWTLADDRLKHWAQWFNDPETFLNEWEKQ